MTPVALHLRTKILPGSRIELAAPELPEGRYATVFVIGDDAEGSQRPLWQNLGDYDEYGNYAGEICRMLEEGADEFKLKKYLISLIQNSMGFSADEKHQSAIARRLLLAKEACEDRNPYRSSNQHRK